MENPVTELRRRLNLTQVQLAARLGVYPRSIANWERGTRPEIPNVDKLKSLAAETGNADLALVFSSDDWQVRRVFHPGEIIISQSSQKSAANPRNSAVYYHQILDRVLASGNEKAIAAVIGNLELFDDYISQAPPATLAIPREKTSARRRTSPKTA